MSFREYLALKFKVDVSAFDPFKSTLKAFKEVLDACNVMAAFKKYKQEGFRPIFLEGNYHDRILAIIEKSIYGDVPFFVPSIADNHLLLMNSVMGHLATSPVPTLNIESMASEWALGKEKLYQLLDRMEHVGLINIIRHAKDNRVNSKGAKILFADPSMYSALNGQTGSIREALVATIFRQQNRKIFACKDERKGDFEADGMTLEVGGKNKKLKASDFVLRDDLDAPSGKHIPLWSVAMMY